MAEEAKGAEPKTSPEPKPVEPVKGAEDAQTAAKEEKDTLQLSREDVDKIVKAAVQSETDRVRGELYTKLRSKDVEIEELKKSKMTAEEVRKYKEEQLSMREEQLKQKELSLAAVDALREAGLKVDYRDFVLADSPEAIKEKIAKLKELYQKDVEKTVAEKFKEAGHTPGKGSPADSKAKIFTREQIRAMSPEEVQKRLPELQEAMKDGRIR
jgi:hypothetical protein